MKIVHGRPAAMEGRQDKEIRTYDLLDSLQIQYWTCDHAPAYTMDDCLAVDRMLETRMCKNIFLCNRQKTAFFLLLMPDDKPFRTKQLSQQLNTSRLSFADGSDMESLLDISPGALSLFGLMNDVDKRVQLIVDEDLLGDAFIGCHPCVNTSSVKIAVNDAFGPFLEATQHTLIPVHLTDEN